MRVQVNRVLWGVKFNKHLMCTVRDFLTCTSYTSHGCLNQFSTGSNLLCVGTVRLGLFHSSLFSCFLFWNQEVVIHGSHLLPTRAQIRNRKQLKTYSAECTCGNRSQWTNVFSFVPSGSAETYYTPLRQSFWITQQTNNTFLTGFHSFPVSFPVFHDSSWNHTPLLSCPIKLLFQAVSWGAQAECSVRKLPLDLQSDAQ